MQEQVVDGRATAIARCSNGGLHNFRVSLICAPFGRPVSSNDQRPIMTIISSALAQPSGCQVVVIYPLRAY